MELSVALRVPEPELDESHDGDEKESFESRSFRLRFQGCCRLLRRASARNDVDRGGVPLDEYAGLLLMVNQVCFCVVATPDSHLPNDNNALQKFNQACRQERCSHSQL